MLGRGIAPVEFEGNTVAYEEGVQAQLENKLFLKDAISDLPALSYISCLCFYIIFAAFHCLIHLNIFR